MEPNNNLYMYKECHNADRHYTESHNAEFCYAECHSIDCCGIFILIARSRKIVKNVKIVSMPGTAAAQ